MTLEILPNFKLRKTLSTTKSFLNGHTWIWTTFQPYHLSEVLKLLFGFYQAIISCVSPSLSITFLPLVNTYDWQNHYEFMSQKLLFRPTISLATCDPIYVNNRCIGCYFTGCSLILPCEMFYTSENNQQKYFMSRIAKSLK